MSSEIPIPAPLSATPIAPASFVFSVLQGLIGPPGLAGAAGVAGAAGATGSSGVAGATGTTGAAGTAGSAGVAGVAGLAGAAGVAGAAGAAGSVGPAGITGPAGVNAAGLTGIVTKSPPTGLTAAVGDGIADDTIALNAIIQYCQDNYLVLYWSPGLYKVTSPLHVCNKILTGANATVGGQQPGFTWLGLSSHSATGTDAKGVTIKMAAANQEAVIIIGSQVSLQNRIENMTIDGGGTALNTGASLKTRATYWSGLQLNNVNMQASNIALYISNPDGGSNGEFVNLNHCYLSAHVSMYKADDAAGQSTPHSWTTIMGGIDNGGVCFDTSGGSANLMISGLSVTAGGGALVNTLLRNNGAANVKISGGRCELIDTAYIGASGGPVSGHVKIEDIHFDGMQNHGPLFALSGAAQETITLENCIFSGVGTLAASGGAAGNAIAMFRCTFGGWTSVAGLQSITNLTLESCRSGLPGGNLTPLIHN